MVGLGGKQILTPAQLRSNICRYRRKHPEASTSQIARRFGVSRQLAHKVLSSHGLPTASNAHGVSGPKSATAKRRFDRNFYRFVARVRSRTGKDRVATALGVTRQTLWRYELPPEHPRHRAMPEGLRKKYKAAVAAKP